jgi:branched-subunit amino acid ABC-type transport system permease component
VVSGLAVGGVYALVGLGFTLVWALTRVVAFAHGDVVVTAVLLAVLTVVGRTPVAAGLGVPASAGVVLLALALGAALSALAYAVAVRPFLARPGRAADETGWVAGGVTAGLVLRTVAAVALPAAAYAVPDPLHLDALTATGALALPGGGSLPVRALPVLGVALLLAAAVDRFLAHARVGRAMRAVAADVDAAALCGVPVERVVLAAFVVAGLLAAAAGVLDAPGGTVGPDDGVLLGLAGAAAAVAGRLGSARGAVVAALALGVGQQLVQTRSAGWASLTPLLLLVAALLARAGDAGAGGPVAQ